MPQDTVDIAIKDLKAIKDAYLAKKQGEALERASHPRTHNEGLGLGYYGPETVLALDALDMWENIINALTGLEDQTIHKFTETIGIASGSRSAKRLEMTLETVGFLGQYIPAQKGFPLQPEHVDLNQ